MTLTHERRAAIAATYDATADNFDAVPLAFWERYGRRTIEHLTLAPGARVLDVGCGSGASALPAAEVVGPDGAVIGVDLSEGLLTLGRGKAAARGLGNVEFRASDMTALDFPDSDFDAVVSVFSIFFVPDMERQIAELWRLVRPGGLLAVTTWGPNLFEPGETAFWKIVREIRPDLYSRANPWDRIIDVASVERLMADGGVESVEVIAEAGRQPLTRPEDWWTITIGSGNRGVVDVMTRKEAAETKRRNLDWARAAELSEIETNVIYAVAAKP